jgi:RHS repeat-associated protein
LSDEGAKIQVSLTYSDGFGREIQTKMQAEDGEAPRREVDVSLPSGDIRPGELVRANGELVNADMSNRWVGTGRTVFNNKGNPMRQYEPFFSATPLYEPEREMTDTGVSSVLFYDPIERVVATLHPNHTYEKVVFDPWQQTTWDVNDTVLGDPPSDADIRGYTAGYFAALPEWQTWHAQRQGGALGAHEEAAAAKAAAHADTPTTAYFDTLGRPFLTIERNWYKRDDEVVDEDNATRVELDIEGNQLAVRDASVQSGDGRGRIVMRYDYHMAAPEEEEDGREEEPAASHRIRQASMEAGERWMLADVTGKPIRAWDSRGHIFRTEYDALRRPLRSYVTGTGPEDSGGELLTERLVYGEQHPEAEGLNLRGESYLHLDQAGALATEAYDFKGNPLSSTRRIAKEYKLATDWNAVDAALPADATDKFDRRKLEAALARLLAKDTFTITNTYDALNRPISVVAPDDSDYRATFNKASLLEKVDVNLRRAKAATPFVTKIDYDAKGQRTRIAYGNGAVTTYEYDPLTFRLVSLVTRRNNTDDPEVQDLQYVYDPAGNITHIQDDAQQTIFFRNERVEPSATYTYDAMYRLIEATGREHLGQIGGPPIPHSDNDSVRVGLPHPGDGNAMGTYKESYEYDAVGNFTAMRHRGSDLAHPGWTRTYNYAEASLIKDDTGKHSNRLSSTTTGNGNTEPYAHDAHGNLLKMPHLQVMQWNFKDQLQMTQRQAVNARDAERGKGERTWYVYDGAGKRVRKITERDNGKFKDERIYLGGFEIYRKDKRERVVRETFHVMDGEQRIAIVETETKGRKREQLIRYQLGNYLGSASLELDGDARIISYEEYTPFGSTSYQAVANNIETPKRYRFTGKERDEESGLGYHDARYYAPWLGRWTAADPVGVAAGLNLFVYAANDPTGRVDPAGTEPGPPATAPSRIRRFEEISRGAEDDWNTARSIGKVAISDLAKLWAGLYTRVDTTDWRETVFGLPGIGRLWKFEGFKEAFRQEERIRRGAAPASASEIANDTPNPRDLAPRGERTTLTNVNVPGWATISTITQYREKSGPQDQDGSGFSGVYNSETGEWVALASSGKLLSGEEIQLIPRAGGHGIVAAELERRTGISRTNPKNVGFAIIWDGMGKVTIKWDSGTINRTNYGRRAAPDNVRAAIVRAITAQGLTVTNEDYE